MKKSYIVMLATTLVLMLSSCNQAAQQSAGNESPAPETADLSRAEIKTKTFDQLFKSIDVKDIPGEPFTLVSENYGILTVGNSDKFNSMVTSWGGWGIQFGKPAVFHMLRSNRYTLELIREQDKYTVSFFDQKYKQDLMPFGRQSGRDSNKMAETQLSPVQTPNGRMAYKEASIILECTLQGVTTVSPDDFKNEDNRKFITDAYAETGDYHKIVFSEITNVWIRK